MTEHDTLLRFIFKQTPMKGACVKLTTAWKSMRQYQKWPVCITRLMGEMTAGSILLASSLKFEGSLIMQVQGDGPVRLAIVEVRNGLLVRATVKMNTNEELSDSMDMKALLNAHGRGRCAIMLDPKDRREGEPLYQGVVPLTGENIAQALMGYMEQSEQIHTKLWLAADENAVGGLMLQQMPDFGGKDENIKDDEESVNRIETLAATITDEELLGLSCQEVTHRLFWEEAPEYFEATEPKFACTCSREKVAAMIKNLGEVEALQIIKDEGKLEVTCDFCGRNYVRKRNKYRVFWICSGMSNQSGSGCKQYLSLREDTLYELTSRALEIPQEQLTKEVLNEKLEKIIVHSNKDVDFLFKNGDVKTLHFEFKSRKYSWTPEMKEQARRKELERLYGKSSN